MFFDKPWLRKMLELQKTLSKVSLPKDAGAIWSLPELRKLMKYVDQQSDWSSDLLAMANDVVEAFGPNLGTAGETNSGKETSLSKVNVSDDGDQLFVDVVERNRDIILTAFIPGIRGKDDISVSLEDSILFITAKVYQGEENAAKKPTTVKRVVRLPAIVEPDRVIANYHDDYLTIRLMKKQQKGKEIRVNFS